MFICQESNNYSPNSLAAKAISDPPSGLRAVAQGRSMCHTQRLGDTHHGTGHCPLPAGGGYEAGVKCQGCGIVCVLGRERARVMKVTVSYFDRWPCNFGREQEALRRSLKDLAGQ